MSILILAPAATFATVAGDNVGVTPSPAISTINRLYLDTTAGAANIVSIVAGVDGQLLWVWNQGPNAANLIAGSFVGSAQDLTMLSGDSILLFYDGAAAAWVMGV